MDEETAPGERVVAVLATFDAAAVHRAAGTLSPADLGALAGALAVPSRLLREDAAAARILQRRTRSLDPAARPEIALTLTTACNEDTVAALGARHGDPTREDMVEVLDPIVERHGHHTVALMLAAYVDSAAPCATVFADLLDTDARFALDSLAEATSPDDSDRGEHGEGASPLRWSAGAASAAGRKAAGTPDPDREARRRKRKERERTEKDRRAHRAAAADAARRRRKEARRRGRGG